MSGQITNYGSELFLKAILGRSFNVPQVFYIAMVLSAEPTIMSSGSSLDEPTGPSYERAIFQNSTDRWIISGTESISNSTAIEFPIANEDWGTAKFFAICDAQTGGNIIAFGDLATPQEILESSQLIIAIGGLSFTLFNTAYEGD